VNATHQVRDDEDRNGGQDEMQEKRLHGSMLVICGAGH
jgi:hypothetical protein